MFLVCLFILLGLISRQKIEKERKRTLLSLKERKRTMRSEHTVKERGAQPCNCAYVKQSRFHYKAPLLYNMSLKVPRWVSKTLFKKLSNLLCPLCPHLRRRGGGGRKIFFTAKSSNEDEHLVLMNTLLREKHFLSSVILVKTQLTLFFHPQPSLQNALSQKN